MANNPRATDNLRAPWKKGQSGNPGGRPKGQELLRADFINALAADFAEHGAEAIRRAREEDPLGYIKVIASLMPKDVKLSARPLEEMSDGDLVAAIEFLQQYLDALPPASAATDLRGPLN